jgi:glycosyltransferase involved in cell wall biosynthesis
MSINNSDIKFTVIIPTRERADTLKWSLKTCTTQDYENLEIIVSDNFSQDQTKDVVHAYKDNRIRYVNTGKRVSMTSNFEFALSHATGDYICFIGDDDGLIPDALHNLNQILFETEIEAISWKKPVYFWDQHYNSEYQNTLTISFNSNSQKFDLEKTLEELLEFKPNTNLNFNDLACLYHGFVKRETIDSLRLPDGRFFNSVIPDVYASLIISSSIKSLYQTDVPYSMYGVSKNSTGNASENSQSLHKFMSETDLPTHPSIKIVPISAPICTAECVLKIQDNFPETKKYNLNVYGMTRKAMEDAIALSADNYQLVADGVRYICEAYNIKEHANLVINQNPNSPNTSPVILGYNFSKNHLVIKFNKNVQNIYDATLAYKNIYEKVFKKINGFYVLEVNRFLINYMKNFGVKNSINKVMHHFIKKLGFVSKN